MVWHRRDAEPSTRDARRQIKQRTYRAGHVAEFASAAMLMGRGCRILERRYKTHSGEIDLIIRKGRRIGFVEVKLRPTRQLCEAAVTDAAAKRIRAAADIWIAKNRAFHGFSFGFDLVFVQPWRVPQYLPNRL